MKKRYYLSWLLLMSCWLAVACSSLPRVYPGSADDTADNLSQCAVPFPVGDWQFTHSIETSLPGGHKGFLIGLSVISSEKQSVQSVIMTIEGMVLFNARADGGLTVNRAVSPFDGNEFASGMMRDIQLIFFAPPGPPAITGTLKDGATVCRHLNADGGTIDVIVNRNRTWEIRRYSKTNRLVRKVSGQYDQIPDHGSTLPFATTLELKAYDPSGYKLLMKLLEATEL